ncbi:MAG TPA: glycine C-acetyltransferase [Rhodanobacteraceae bacterium]|jgi:glycine C-acetyltransferase|nr:glycine C-acetyltransferase [Rhodanobacteraceae bacterium]
MARSIEGFSNRHDDGQYAPVSAEAAMDNSTRPRLEAELESIRDQGLFKTERVITTPQSSAIRTADGRKVLNFCANNYLGLADHPDIIAAAKDALDTHGFGLASVRFICGTQDLHKQLEATIAKFFGTDDAILYTSCFDANGGLFETILNDEDVVISDALNHASIIDGIRLCKAERRRYANGDMAELEKHLSETQGKRTRLIATDGVFSMDGFIAKLDEIVALKKKYNALLMVDDSHATGFVGPTGRGSAELHGVMREVDMFTSTLGKALGGGSGGFTTGNQAIVDLLRQRSRPYLFSNTLPPPLVAASIKVFEMLSSSTTLRDKVNDNALYFRKRMTEAGFDIRPGTHPIAPVMLYDAKLAQAFAKALLDEGIYVIGFFYPVVPQGQARIRTQMSAAHTHEQIDRAVDAFVKVGRELGVLKA